MKAPYKNIHVIINPAAGHNEPILNTLNDVFNQYGVKWEVNLTATVIPQAISIVVPV